MLNLHHSHTFYLAKCLIYTS